MDYPIHPWWADLSTTIKSFLTAFAVVCGGGWALYRFGLRRESAAALGIELTYTDSCYDKYGSLVTFDVSVRNIGSVKVTIRRSRNPAYPRPGTIDTETLNYGASLLIRRIPEGKKPNETLQWFDSTTSTSPRKADSECDLASEYEAQGLTDFWLEPKETYHLSTTIVLRPGHYLAMVTLVGESTDEDFWRRIFAIRIFNRNAETNEISAGTSTAVVHSPEARTPIE
jgi:hypothetical protein